MLHDVSPLILFYFLICISIAPFALLFIYFRLDNMFTVFDTYLPRYPWYLALSHCAKEVKVIYIVTLCGLP